MSSRLGSTAIVVELLRRLSPDEELPMTSLEIDEFPLKGFELVGSLVADDIVLFCRFTVTKYVVISPFPAGNNNE